MAILSLKQTLVSALLLLSSPTRVSAQDTFSFLPSTATSSFPQCGLSCQLLLEAQSACVPPEAAVTNSDTYVSCFCQSSLISGLPYTASMCPTCTSTSDQQLLINWYKNYCAGGFQSTLTTSSTSSTATTTSGSSATTTGPSTASTVSTIDAAAAPTSASDKGSSASSSNAPKSWFSTHWRWVVMLIVLVVGFSTLSAIAIWFKKRLDAKQPGLYHGDDRNPPEDRGSAAGGFFAGSLRNLSKTNLNSARTSTINNSSTNNVGTAGSKAPKMQQQPGMSTTSFSNNRSSIISNVLSHHSSNTNMNNNTTNNNNNNNNHPMWGHNQARNLEDVAPVEEPVFRNSVASAAAVAAYDKNSIGVALSTANNSRTDLSSIGTGGGRVTPSRNLNRLSIRSASNLQQPPASSSSQQQHYQQQQQRGLQRPKSASPLSPNSPGSPVSPVSPISPVLHE